MVPPGLRRSRARAGRAGALGAVVSALALSAACAGGGPAADEASATDPGVRAAERVRARYTARDAVVAGAWTWEAPSGLVFVLADVQSTLAGLVQARLDLWVATDSTLDAVGRSDVLSAAAEISAWAFDDVTGDQVPDFFGSVADSAGTTFPIFVPGALGAMPDELATAAPAWRFDVLDSLPAVVARPGGAACGLRLWAEAPAPDGRPAGWRVLPIATGQLAAPRSPSSAC